jgi:hypothetical protein
MKWRALDLLGERVLLGEPFGAHDTWNWCRAGKRKDRPHGEALRERAARDVLRNPSIETPALMRQTLDWLSSCRLKGISRD